MGIDKGKVGSGPRKTRPMWSLGGLRPHDAGARERAGPLEEFITAGIQVPGVYIARLSCPSPSGL